MDEKPICYNVASMFDLLWLCVGAFLRLLSNRQNLMLENLALRQQLIVLKRKHRPTVTFKLLYCFFIISHDRRQILHLNVTPHPTSSWIVQQLREAFPYQSTPKFLLFDHDQKYGLEVPAAIQSMRITCVQPRSRAHGKTESPTVG
jgi:hypothetical protein